MNDMQTDIARRNWQPLRTGDAICAEIMTAKANGDGDRLLQIRKECEGTVRLLASLGFNTVKQNEYAYAKALDERALGHFLGLTKMAVGGRPTENLSPGATGFSLPGAGINRSQSSRWQTMAWRERGVVALEEEIFEAAVIAIKQREEVITTKGIVREIIRILNGEDIPTPIDLPDGQYRVVVIDPPWDMQKIERDCAERQVSFDYPTMSVDEIARMKMPAADDCHLFMWTTQKFLPAAFEILSAWEFKYVLTMVWHKPGGFQPFGLPQYNCEFVLYGRRGSPKFCDTRDFPACFNAPRREHSRKPDEFYELINRVTDGPRIDMFSREEREGFKTWGNEAGKFNADSNGTAPDYDLETGEIIPITACTSHP